MTDTLVVDRIESNLTRLRLPRIREILEAVLNASEKKDASYLNFLDELLEEEVAAKVYEGVLVLPEGLPDEGQPEYVAPNVSAFRLLSILERVALGKAARKRAPRSSHAE